MGALPPPNSHVIDLNSAIKQTAAYREFNKNLSPDFPFRHGFCFNRDILDTALQAPGCQGLRFYFGVTQNPVDPLIKVGNEKNVLTVIFCAVDGNGDDILSTNVAGAVLSSGGENSWPCPPHCSAKNALNGLP
ncbi:hypothetical protein ACPPVU_08205 [Mucilaginibacter sp. McL0603]|uniref:hypothetical protein n=1 Tax=Mucilaginibacter sp. McL0603 TaxID=3415670 RepID=UPI003CF470A5